MAGTVKRVLDAVMAARGHNDPTFIEATRAKLILKGMNPARFTESTPDDPIQVARARKLAAEFGVSVP